MVLMFANSHTIINDFKLVRTYDSTNLRLNARNYNYDNAHGMYAYYPRLRCSQFSSTGTTVHVSSRCVVSRSTLGVATMNAQPRIAAIPRAMHRDHHYTQRVISLLQTSLFSCNQQTTILTSNSPVLQAISPRDNVNDHTIHFPVRQCYLNIIHNK